MRRVVRLAAAAVVLALLGAVPVSSAEAADETSGTKGLSYVALGDSFAAGLGLSPATGEPVVGCAQSGLDYPHRVAETAGLRLTDVSCSGAVTANVTSTPQKTGSGTAPLQLSALSRSTRVVTLTIGGNDIGFFTIAAACIALSPTGPIVSSGKSNCRSSYQKNGVDSLTTRVTGALLGGTGSGNGLTATFAAIKSAAPRATVFVVGYPTILPDAANTPASGCFRASVSGTDVSALRIDNGLPFTTTDVSYLNSIEQSLDATTERAAQDAGFTYISALAATATHSACAPPAERYINGIGLSSDAKLNITLSTAALHPNARGTAFLATLVDAAVKKAFPAKPAAPVAPGPAAAESPAPWIVAGVLVVVLVVVLFAGAAVLWRRGRRTDASP